jgi:hypothetical protein
MNNKIALSMSLRPPRPCVKSFALLLQKIAIAIAAVCGAKLGVETFAPHFSQHPELSTGLTHY